MVSTAKPPTKNAKLFAFGSRLKMLTAMIGSFMFIGGIQKLLPDVGIAGSIVVGIALLWWSQKAKK